MDTLDTSNSILWYCLRNARPDGSKAIQGLMDRLESLAKSVNGESWRDKFDNLWIDTRENETQSTLFMAHMDTVEQKPGIKEIFYSEDGKMIHTNGKAVLGADDGAGVAILAHLIEHGKPALYLFSQAEESGGMGGNFAARHGTKHLNTIERCISFDRKGKKEICGSQSVGNLASDEFVSELSKALGLGHVNGTGTYTDNSEFQGIIPEIVNISCGYENNHSKMEVLDWVYFQALRDAVLAVDFEMLPTFGPKEDYSHHTSYDDASCRDWERSSPRKTSAIKDALYDICDTLAVDPSSYEGSLILDSLETMAYRIEDEMTNKLFDGTGTGF
jgi:hypothetical protein